jgi:hypothetical protein
LAIPAAGPEQAIPRLLASARVAQLQLGVELCERQLRQGLALLTDVADGPDRRLREALFESRLAQILFLIHGNAVEAAARQRRARELCPPGEAEALVSILMGEATTSGLWGDIAGAVAAADELVALARETENLQAESDGEYSRCFMLWTGPPDVARQSLDRSVELAESVEAARGLPTRSHVPLATKPGMRSLAMVLSGDTEGAREEGRSAVAVAGRQTDAWALSWTGAFVMISATLAGDPEEVLRLWYELAAPAAGLAYTDALIEACRAWAAADRTELCAARSRLAAAGDGLMQVPLLTLEAELLVALGSLGVAGEVLEEAGRLAEAGGQLVWLPEIERLAATAAGARGDVDEAGRLLRSALKRAHELGLKLFAARGRQDLAVLG